MADHWSAISLFTLLTWLCFFCFGFVFFFLWLRRITRRRLMIGGVKARSFKYHAHWRDHFLQGFLSAFGANFKRLIRERLLTFELDSAIFTTIGVNRHSTFSLTRRDYSAPMNLCQDLDAACYNFLTLTQRGHMLKIEIIYCAV